MIIASFVALAIGLLLFCEVLRPFRDLAIDGPLALACWICGALLAIIAIVQRRRRAFAILALIANVIALLGVGVILFLLSRTMRLF